VCLELIIRFYHRMHLRRDCSRDWLMACGNTWPRAGGNAELFCSGRGQCPRRRQQLRFHARGAAAASELLATARFGRVNCGNRISQGELTSAADFCALRAHLMDLTVAIPVFNEELAIFRSVSSVLNQSWGGSYEILIVDDGSTDGTVEAVERLSEQFPQIRLVRHARNLGRPAARSTLAREARGLWYAMLDADDEWYPNKLERQFALIAELEAEGIDTSKLMVCGNIHHVDRDTGEERVKNFYQGYGVEGYDAARVLKGDNAPISQFALLRSEFAREIGEFDADLKRAQDWDFLIRFFLKGGQTVWLPNPPLALFNFRRGGRNADEIERCMMRVIDKHLPEYGRHSLDPDAVRRSIRGYIDSFRQEN